MASANSQLGDAREEDGGGDTAGWRRGAKDRELSLGEHSRRQYARHDVRVLDTQMVATSENTRIVAERPGFVWKPSADELCKALGITMMIGGQRDDRLTARPPAEG